MRVVKLVASALLFVLLAVPCLASTRYVATNGSDSNSGTSTAPWRTIRKALTSLCAGDVLYVRGGTYLERVTGITIRQGTSTAPITVVACPGERPVIKGLLWLSRPSYWRINGINVTWDPATGLPNQHMVKVTNGVGWSITGAEIWGAQSYAGVLIAGTIAGEPAQWSFAYNCVHDTYPTNLTNQDHLMYVNTGVSAGTGLIERNILYNAANGNGVKLGGADSSQGTANVTVRYNTIYNTVQNILVAWQSHDNTICDNLMQRVSGTYGNLRGYQLAGQRNIAYNNCGYQARTLILNDSGYSGVWNSGGNVFPLDPLFDYMGPTGFHPQNAAAQCFGRYAP